MHANFVALCVIERELLPIEVLHCGNTNCRLFDSCDLDFDPMTFIMNFTRSAWRWTSYVHSFKQTDTTEIMYHAASQVVTGQWKIFSSRCCLNFVATYISPNRVILAGRNGTLECTASYSPPYWHYYSLTPGSKPCGFGSYHLQQGISHCSSVSRISVTYSATQRYSASLTITRAQLSDAGTYTCGPRNPRHLSRALSVIVGVIGRCTLCKKSKVK